MSNTTTPAKAPNKLAETLKSAHEAAQAVAPRKSTGKVLAGPFPVGNIGEVSAIERGTVTYAEFVGTNGRAKSIPLAAVGTLHAELG